MPVSLRLHVADHVGHELQVGRALDFGNDDGVDVPSLQDLFQVVFGQAGGDGVDAHGLLADRWGAGLVEERAQRGASGRFCGRRDGVLEVVCYVVRDQGPGFVEHLL